MSFWNKKTKLGETQSANGTTSSSSHANSHSGVDVHSGKFQISSVEFSSMATSSSSASSSISAANEDLESSATLNFHAAPKKTRCALGSGTSINGKLTFDTPVTIDGILYGEVFSSDTVYVGETAMVSATINASSLYINGSVDGDITARDRIEVKGNGKLSGSISTKTFVLEEGCSFAGDCVMSGRREGR